MKKKKVNDLVSVNRKAHFDYFLGDELTVGMVLEGPEVRSIRDHHVQLKGSYVTIRNGELWLYGLTLGGQRASEKRVVGVLVLRSDVLLNVLVPEVVYRLDKGPVERLVELYLHVVEVEPRR